MDWSHGELNAPVEEHHRVSRLDQARVDRILADHNPWKEVG
jgi:hypothetical protein